jgi:hypothetical protein
LVERVETPVVGWRGFDKLNHRDRLVERVETPVVQSQWFRQAQPTAAHFDKLNHRASSVERVETLWVGGFGGLNRPSVSGS